MKNTIKKLLGVISAAAALCLVLSGCATTGTDAGGGAGGILMLVVMLAIFYFFLIRPENKKRKQAEEMRSNLSVGDKITTIGGIVGKIVEINGELLTFETGEDRVRLQVTKWAVSTNTIDKSGENSK